MYEPSLMTHFQGQVDRATLSEVRGFGFRGARLDCSAPCPVDTMVAMLADCDACDLRPLPMVWDTERLAALAGREAEWGNEPDFTWDPAAYRAELDIACAVARERGVALYAPALGNLSRDALGWLEAVRGGGWPDGLHGISVHRYGDGTFEWAHDGFRSRADEVAALLALCDGLPFIVTEFGYPTNPIGARFLKRVKADPLIARRLRFLNPDVRLTEADAAANIAKEWAFWRRVYGSAVSLPNQ